MTRELGSYNTSGTRTHVRFQFSTHAAAGGNVAPSSAFEAADIRIYRANDSAAYSATQRSSANGITMTSPFDSLTGVHDVDIDLADNTDAGFYAAGYRYSVVLAPDETIDSQTITGVVLAEFEIGPPPANVTQLGGDAQSATDLKDFADTGYDPATHKVAGVVTVDAVTTLNGIANGVITENSIASSALTSAKFAAGVFPTNFASMVITAGGVVRAFDDQGNAVAPAATALSTGTWTTAHAGYLANLNVGGAVASQADITALNQSASRRITLSTVQQYERPESGSSTYQIEARTYDGDGAATNADSTPTLTATGIVSGSLAANLSAATNPATGVYRWTYTVANNATVEQIRFDLSATIGGSTFTMGAFAQVADFVASTFTTTDRANIEAILADTGTDGVVVAAGSKTGYQLAGTVNDFDELITSLNSAHGSGSWATATGFSTHSAADVWAVGTRALTDKLGFKLAVDGVDLILIESGISAGAGLTNDTGTQLTSINLRQAIAILAAANGGVLDGNGTASVTIKPAGKPAGNTRITGTIDASKNRDAVSLKVPD